MVLLCNDWQFGLDEANEAKLEAVGLAPPKPQEAATMVTLDPGAYTVVIEGMGAGLINDQVGNALFEVYDLDAEAASRLANVSSRAIASTVRFAIAGVIATGSGQGRVLFRAVGPSLAASGVSEPLADPVLELHDSQGTLIARNDNWKDTQRADIEATGIAPTDDAEAAILFRLSAGVYTAVVRGKGFDGITLVEAYLLAD